MFGIIMLVYGSIWGFYIRKDYIQDYFILEKFVAPNFQFQSHWFRQKGGLRNFMYKYIGFWVNIHKTFKDHI